jgi:hypothetical protein
MDFHYILVSVNPNLTYAGFRMSKILLRQWKLLCSSWMFFCEGMLMGFFFFNLQKKSKDHFGIEGDEGSTMVEDSVSPLK